jgi:hypothetical protein
MDKRNEYPALKTNTWMRYVDGIPAPTIWQHNWSGKTGVIHLKSPNESLSAPGYIVEIVAIDPKASVKDVAYVTDKVFVKPVGLPTKIHHYWQQEVCK